MKIFYLSLALFWGTALFSSDKTLFRDEDTGFVMQVPAGIKRTWSLSNCENGMEINIFQTEENEEQFSLIAIAKCPLSGLVGEEGEALYPFLAEEFKGFMEEEGEDLDFDFQMTQLPSLAEEKYRGQRYRISFGEDEEDEEEDRFTLDIHAFLIDSYSYIVVTTTYPCEWGDELDHFTKQVLKNVHFIGESP